MDSSGLGHQVTKSDWIRADRDNHEPSTWGEAVLGSAQFWLLIPILTIPKLLVLIDWTTWGSPLLSILNAIFLGSMIVLMVTILVIAWRQKWPTWFASWIFLFVFLAFSPLLMLSSMFEEVSRVADVFSEFAAFVLLPMLVAVMLYYLACQDPLKSLLAALPILLVLWSPNMEFVPDQIETPIIAVSLVLSALMAVMLLRLGDWRIGVWLVLLVYALIGLQYAYAGIYHGGMLPFSAPAPSIGETIKSFVPQFLMGSTLVVGPLLAVAFRGIGRSAGRRGWFLYHLALLGIMLLLGCLLCSYFLFTDGRLQEIRWWLNPWLFWVGMIGVLVYLVATVWLGWVLLKPHSLSKSVNFVLLALLILLLPVVLVQLASLGWIPEARVLGVFTPLTSLPHFYQAVFGFAWLLLAGWLITIHSPQLALLFAAVPD